MIIIRLLCCLLLAAVVLPDLSLAGEPLVEMNDPVGENIVAEAEAARVLIGAAREAIAAGTLTLSADPLAALERAATGWAEVRRLALDRQFGAAYKVARKARPELRAALYDALGGKLPTPVSEAIKGWVEVTGPRLQAIERQVVNYPLTDTGRENQMLGAAHWAEAQKAAKKKDWSLAFRLVVEAMGELDQTLLECYPASR